MKPEIMKKGKDAKDLLSSPVFVEAVEAVKGKIRRGWEQSSSASDREGLWRQFKALEMIEAELRNHVVRLEMAERREKGNGRDD